MAPPLIPPPPLQATVRSLLGLPPIPAALPPRGDRHEPSEGRRTPSRPLAEKFRRPPAVPWPPQPRPLPAAEITRALRRFRYDPEFRGVRRVPIRTLAGLVGLSYETIYQAMVHRVMSHRTRAKLTWAIEAISDGQLHFRRRGQAWEIEGRILDCQDQQR
jgi:hypothetical protein